MVEISADNFIAVFSSKDSLGRDLRWYVAEGMMPSIETEDNAEKWKKQYIKRKTAYSYPTREAALVAAHDLLKEASVVEYGVIEI